MENRLDMDLLLNETTDAAEGAVAALNGKELSDGKILYEGRDQNNAERQLELKHKFEELKKKRQDTFHGISLYVKNLDDSVDNERLRNHFAPFGDITSAKVITEKDGCSKGFGFVCFSSADEATRAVTEMNGRILGTKPLYVALANRKDDRKAHLVRMRGGFFVQIRSTSRWAPQAQVRQTLDAQGSSAGTTGFSNIAAAASTAPFGPGSSSTTVRETPQAQPNAHPSAAPKNPALAITAQQAGTTNMQTRQMAAQVTSAPQGSSNYQFTPNMRNPPGQPVQTQPIVQNLNTKGQEPINTSLLANATPADQTQILKNILRERLD